MDPVASSQGKADTPEQAHQIYEQLAQGGEKRIPIQTKPDNQVFGTVVDPFGLIGLVSYP